MFKRQAWRRRETQKEKREIVLELKQKGEKSKEGAKEKVQQAQGRREGERPSEKLRTRTRVRERGERNVLTLCFLSELPKLIISSGLAEPCQEQEPTARPGPPCSQRHPHPSPKPPPPHRPALGPNRRRCLPACLGRAGPGTLPQGFCLFRSFD